MIGWINGAKAGAIDLNRKGGSANQLYLRLKNPSHERRAEDCPPYHDAI